MIPLQSAYFFGSLVFILFWIPIFYLRKDLRREMLFISILVGILSVLTSYLWWTADWWRPLTITGTRVGIEDFITGFGAGGIMAIAYEEIFKKRHKKMRGRVHYPGIFTTLLLLAGITSFLFWGLHLTSFISSSLAMIIVFIFMFYFRKDLFMDGILSGTIMMLVSIPVYLFLEFFSPQWILRTYQWKFLSRAVLGGIPIEELIFWFLAGMVFGPLYEYWQGQKLKSYK